MRFGLRIAFRVASYWDLEGSFDAGAKHDERVFPAKLHSVDGARVATAGPVDRRALLLGTPVLDAIHRRYRDGAVIGYAYAGAYRTRPAYRSTVEDSVYVARPAQGQGVGDRSAICTIEYRLRVEVVVLIGGLASTYDSDAR